MVGLAASLHSPPYATLCPAGRNNPATRNVNTLLAHVHQRLPRVSHLVQEDVQNTASAMCLARHCCLWLMRHQRPGHFARDMAAGKQRQVASQSFSAKRTLQGFLAIAGSNPAVQPNEELDGLTFQGFVGGVLDFVADVPPSLETHDVVVEALSFLLALLSSHLRCATPQALPTSLPPQPLPPSELLSGSKLQDALASAASPALVPTDHPAWDALFQSAWSVDESQAGKKAGMVKPSTGAGHSMRASRFVARLLSILANPAIAARGSAAVEATASALAALSPAHSAGQGQAQPAQQAVDILDTLGELAATVVLSPLHLLRSIWSAGAAAAGAPGHGPPPPLLHRAALVLLLIVHSHRSAGAIPNPFHHILTHAVDTSTAKSPQPEPEPELESEHASVDGGAEAGAAAEAVHNPLKPRGLPAGALSSVALKACAPLRLRMSRLIKAMARQDLQPTNALLLYTLMQGNAEFKAHLFASADLTDVVHAHLQAVYHSTAFSAPHRYICLINLLVLSSDVDLASTLHSQLRLGSVPWVRERKVVDVSLGSLAMLVLLRTLHVNLVEWRDAYVSTNCIAALSNFSKTLVGAHQALAQRLVNVVLLVARLLQRSSTAYAKAVMPTVQDEKLATAMLTASASYATLLQQLLGIVRSALRPDALEHNLHILYALLYRQEQLKAVKAVLDNEPPPELPEDIPCSVREVRWDAAAQALQDLMPLVQHCSERVTAAAHEHEDEGHGSLGEAGTVGVLRTAVRTWATQAARATAEAGGADATDASLRLYTYDELPTPETFFVPYVWTTTILMCPDLCWDSGYIRLVPVPSEVDVYRAPPPAGGQPGTHPNASAAVGV